MTITNTITKKLLETIVHETFRKFGNVSSSSLLDSLKLLGFSYATFAGISINIEDLKTPKEKKHFLYQANLEIATVSEKWKQGKLSDTERFQTILDSWNLATESLKNRIIDYYQNYDPTNNLYIMAFSGARGNMSQVRQLVGMRGLMSDPEGKIIDLPIQTNFREGLSSIDYIISSYGARKGIVDTALKTADSGYLTRRLIYISQDIVIREKDCGTMEGVGLFIEKHSKLTNFLGRYLLSAKSQKTFEKLGQFQNRLIDEAVLIELKQSAPLLVTLRSSLTCSSHGSICQYCYGWDLSRRKLVGLGEAVGILAAQSIGEPGTQLTMRTFHTGGIFTGELFTQIVSPFSGKIIFSDSFKGIPLRTSHGIFVSKIQQELSLFLISWQGNIKEIFLEQGSFLYVNSSQFVKKGELIAESFNQSLSPGGRKLKPILSPFSGEIRFQNLCVRKAYREKKQTLKITQENGILWIKAGKIFLLPKEGEINFFEELNLHLPFSSLFVTSPEEGVIQISKEKILLISSSGKFSFERKDFSLESQTFFSKLVFFGKNYQYFDSYTILGSLYFFPKSQGKIYMIRKKNGESDCSFFLVTEEETWKIDCDQVNHYSFVPDKKLPIFFGNIFHQTLQPKNAGYFLKKDGFKMIFQNSVPIFLSQGALLNYKQGDFVQGKKILGNLVNYTQQTEDIVQGLPKIEELIEAIKPKIKASLSIRPGVILNPRLSLKKSVSSKLKTKEESLSKGKEEPSSTLFFQNNLFSFVFPKQKSGLTSGKNDQKDLLKKKKKGKKDEKRKKGERMQEVFTKKRILSVIHSIFVKEKIVIFQKKPYQFFILPLEFSPIANKGESQKYSFRKEKELLVIHGKKLYSSWTMQEKKAAALSWLFFYFQGKLTPWTVLVPNSPIFENKKKDLIVFGNQNQTILLERIEPILDYEIPGSSKAIVSPGKFVDLGEPLSEGMIDIQELFHLFFQYHSTFDDLLIGGLKGLHKFQLVLVNSIQGIYQSQGVNISSKHIEIIVRQMTNKVVIKQSGQTPFLPGELIRFSVIQQIFQCLKLEKYQFPYFEPLLFSATNTSLSKEGFLSSAGFQETKRVLTKAALEGSCDWLRGLKESIIVGRIIPAGSSFLNYKNSLDNVFLFKKREKFGLKDC